MCFGVGATDVIDKHYHELSLIAKINAYRDLKKANAITATSKDLVKQISEDYEALSRRVELVAVQDSLTNLYTRKYAMEQLEIAISRFDRAGVGFSIILGDIDNFKSVNDTYGPTFGDEILMGIGQILKYHSRVQDIVARWGGEEFMMILPDTNLEGAKIYGERARKRIEQKIFVTNDKEISVTMTFGIATYNHVMPLNMIMSLVDDALFGGKTNGKNKVVVSEL
jgi:diguanylate cyclase (GGDEF)-like protein